MPAVSCVPFADTKIQKQKKLSVREWVVHVENMWGETKEGVKRYCI